MARRQFSLSRFIDLRTPVAGPGARCFTIARRRLEARQLTTVQSCLHDYDSLTSEEKFVVLRFFGHVRYRPAVPRLIHELASRGIYLPGAAAGSLADIGGKEVERELLAIVQRRKGGRAWACALSALGHLSRYHNVARVIDLLAPVALDARCHELERTMAVEGISAAVAARAPRRAYELARDTLRKARKDRSRLVRVAAARGLEVSHSRKSLPS